MEETIDLVISACCLPLSIIIIGIGNEDFTYMHQLDSDNVNLVGSNGEVAPRDIVQFVEFEKFKTSKMNDLAREILEEIPRQVCDFYKHSGLDPRVALTYQTLKSYKTNRTKSMGDMKKEEDMSKEGDEWGSSLDFLGGREVRVFHCKELIVGLKKKYMSRSNKY